MFDGVKNILKIQNLKKRTIVDQNKNIILIACTMYMEAIDNVKYSTFKLQLLLAFRDKFIVGLLVCPLA